MQDFISSNIKRDLRWSRDKQTRVQESQRDLQANVMIFLDHKKW